MQPRPLRMALVRGALPPCSVTAWNGARTRVAIASATDSRLGARSSVGLRNVFQAAHGDGTYFCTQAFLISTGDMGTSRMPFLVLVGT